MRPIHAPWLVVFVVSCAPARKSEPTGRVASAPPAASAAASPPAPAPIQARSQAALAYDLDKDVAERQELVARHLGDESHVAVVQDVFVIASPPGTPRAAFRNTLSVVEQALNAYFNGRFAKKPARAVSVYLFPSAGPYDRYCQTLWDGGCRSPYGVYLSESRQIVMNVGLGVGTLTHELVHPLVETDFPNAPDWINEGIASLFERFYFPKPGEIGGAKNWRHPRLVRALGSKHERAVASLPALFAMDDATFRGDLEDLNYATARYFCQWMDQEGWLWPFYQRWRDGYADDPTGERAFVAVTGMSLERADARWARWVRAL